ncbi:MAG: Phosphotransferase enzyme family [Candidatus Saccharibacteria bacterium]|nr:Phosphotransferase enzyme family [Candidatus Saccharibacteria bacterium]
MYSALVPEILAKYGIESSKIFPAQKGYRNESYKVELRGGDEANLIFFKREPQIVDRVNRADAVARIASNYHLPVRIRRDYRLVRLREDSVAGLYSYLPGLTISWEAYTMKHIKLLGWAMADLHTALGPVHDPSLTYHKVTDELSGLVKAMAVYFKSPTVEKAMRQKLGVTLESSRLDDFPDLLDSLATHPEQQMLHLDMVRGNVLFENNTHDQRWSIGNISITGIIDFEKTAYGHILFDLARSLAFLHVDCVSKEPVKIYKYFLKSGYEKRGGRPLDLTANFDGQSYESILQELVNMYLVYDFYKFLVHTPYESLDDNHHYIRTRNILIDHAMLRYL